MSSRRDCRSLNSTEDLLGLLPIPRAGGAIIVHLTPSSGPSHFIQLTRIPDGTIDWLLSTSTERARFTTKVDGSSPRLLCSDIVDANVRWTRLQAALGECRRLLTEALEPRPRAC